MTPLGLPAASRARVRSIIAAAVDLGKVLGLVVQSLEIKVGIGLQRLPVLDDITQGIDIQSRGTPAVIGLVLRAYLYPLHKGYQARRQVVGSVERMNIVLGTAEFGDIFPDAVTANLGRIINPRFDELKFVGLVDDRGIIGIEG